MINHNIPSMNLDQYDEGEISLPSETASAPFASNLRQFIILTRRAYNDSALIDMQTSEGIKLSAHSHDCAPYFGITLKITSLMESIKDFTETCGDDFFLSLLRIVSSSTRRGVSGKRAVFVREFLPCVVSANDPLRLYGTPENNTLETQIVISTSVFYNDYRVTTGFPADQQELNYDVQRMLSSLQDEWSNQLAIKMNGHVNPYEETVGTF